MRNMLIGIVVSALVVCAGRVEGGLVFSNPITGTNPNTSNPYTDGQLFDPNVTVSGIGRGIGISGVNTNDRYNASSWNTGSLDPDAYFTFAITPNPGFLLSFTNFVYTGQASGTGPTSFAFRSSIDNFGGNLGSPTATGVTIDLSGIQFQSVDAPIEFRLYGWGASSGSGTFSVNDFTFNGTVAAVPEPSSFLLLGLAGAFGAVVRRRRLANANLHPSSPCHSMRER